MARLCSQHDAEGQGTAQSTVLARGDEALVPKGLLATFLLSLLAWPQSCRGALSFATQKPVASGNRGGSGACPGSLVPQLTLLATWVHVLLCL